MQAHKEQAHQEQPVAAFPFRCVTALSSTKERGACAAHIGCGAACGAAWDVCWLQPAGSAACGPPLHHYNMRTHKTSHCGGLPLQIWGCEGRGVHGSWWCAPASGWGAGRRKASGDQALPLLDAVGHDDLHGTGIIIAQSYVEPIICWMFTSYQEHTRKGAGAAPYWRQLFGSIAD